MKWRLEIPLLDDTESIHIFPADNERDAVKKADLFFSLEKLADPAVGGYFLKPLKQKKRLKREKRLKRR